MFSSCKGRFAIFMVLLQRILVAAWPTTLLDTSGAGSLCDASKEQYLKVEIHDFHDNPEITATLRQLTGECGTYEWDLKTWTATFDKSLRGDGALGERSQLNLWVCAPFGEYELELESDSYSEGNAARERRTSWQIINGDDEFPIWDTLDSHVANEKRYSPRTAGVYTWPFEGTEDYFSTLYIGRRNSRPCDSYMPPGVAYEGCFARATSPKASFNDGLYQRPTRDGYGMTVEVCSQRCFHFQYFGLENGYKMEVLGVNPHKIA